jgi:hypothetical protein
MKKLFSFFAVIMLLGLGLASCNKNNPGTVAKTFLTSLYQNDYEAAKKVSTKETTNMLNLMEQMNSKISDSAKKELMQIKVNIKSVKETGDNATVTFTTSENPKDQTLHMVKENGQWLAQWTKQDEMSGSDEPDNNAAAKPATDTTQK